MRDLALAVKAAVVNFMFSMSVWLVVTGAAYHFHMTGFKSVCGFTIAAYFFLVDGLLCEILGLLEEHPYFTSSMFILGTASGAVAVFIASAMHNEYFVVASAAAVSTFICGTFSIMLVLKHFHDEWLKELDHI